MRSGWQTWSFTNIDGKEGEIQWRRYYVLLVKCTSLLTDRDQTYNSYCACAVNVRLRFRKIHEIEGEIPLRKYLLLQVNCLLYWPIVTKLKKLVDVQWMIGVEFQNDSRNRGQDTVEKVLCSSSYRTIVTKLRIVVSHVRWVTGVEFQKDPLNRRIDTFEKVLCSSSKVPFVIDRS